VNGKLQVRATLKNTGHREGAEIAQLYIRDLVGSVARPVKELKGFQRILLEPGEERRVEFELPAAEMGFYDLDMAYVVEPGQYKVWIGPDSTWGLEGQFEVHL
jgi:beta-glucosidase